MTWYRVKVEEDDSSDAIMFVVGAVIVCILLAAAVYIGIPVLIGWLIYKFVKWRIKKNKEAKAAIAIRCNQCGKRGALSHYKTEMLKATPTRRQIYAKDGSTSTLEITEYLYRTHYKCKYCNEITFEDEVTDSLKS